MTGYDYRITEQSKSTVPFSEAALNAVPDTIGKITADYQNNFVSEFLMQLHSKTGVTADVARLENLVVSVEAVSTTEMHFLITTRIYFHTLTPLHSMKSPAIWTIAGVIKIVIEVLIIIGVIYTVVWAIQQICASLKSLTTLTNTSEVHDDNATNPETGAANPYYCTWHTITTEQPNPWGSGVVIAIAVVIGIIVLVLFAGFGRKQT